MSDSSGTPDLSLESCQADQAFAPSPAAHRHVVLGLLKTIRPHQWVKNVFVLAAVVFAKEIFDRQLLWHAASAFVIFCLLAGAVYAINDIADVRADRLHPLKRARPIASGEVPLGAARLCASVLVAVALGWAARYGSALFLVTSGYFLQNLAYSAKLKHLAYVDVACIALGFVLRVAGGGYAAHVQVSVYLYLCTALLALFLGFGKRRHELAVAAARAQQQRAALGGYSPRGLDRALVGTGVATLIVYVCYTLDSHTRAFFHSDVLWASSLFVALGELRFLQIVSNRPRAESPTQEMLRDGPFVGVVLLWVVLVMWVVYVLRPGLR